LYVTINSSDVSRFYRTRKFKIMTLYASLHPQNVKLMLSANRSVSEEILINTKLSAQTFWYRASTVGLRLNA